MNLEEILPTELEGSSLEPELRALHGIYVNVQAATEEFQRQSASHLAAQGKRLGCPSGCGACCERFVPDIFPVEANYAALWILRFRPELAETRAPSVPGRCPFFEPDRLGGKCGVYGGRPLICRLFGQAATQSKEGLPAYSLCWKMDDLSDGGERSWTGDRLLEVFGAVPPLMANFGLALESISPQAPRPRPLIGPAIDQALARLRFLISLSGGPTAA